MTTKPESRRRQAIAAARLSEAEYEDVQRFAAARGWSVSALMRDLVLREIRTS